MANLATCPCRSQLAFVQRQHDRRPAGVGYSFAVVTANDDIAVGQIGLWTRDIPEGRVSTDYWITTANRGHGFARAALTTLADWAFSFPEVARMELHVEPRNESSRRTAETCGFVPGGLLRGWLRIGAERRDVFVYTRLAQRKAEDVELESITR